MIYMLDTDTTSYIIKGRSPGIEAPLILENWISG